MSLKIASIVSKKYFYYIGIVILFLSSNSAANSAAAISATRKGIFDRLGYFYYSVVFISICVGLIMLYGVLAKIKDLSERGGNEVKPSKLLMEFIVAALLISFAVVLMLISGNEWLPQAGTSPW